MKLLLEIGCHKLYFDKQDLPVLIRLFKDNELFETKIVNEQEIINEEKIIQIGYKTTIGDCLLQLDELGFTMQYFVSFYEDIKQDIAKDKEESYFTLQTDEETLEFTAYMNFLKSWIQNHEDIKDLTPLFSLQNVKRYHDLLILMYIRLLLEVIDQDLVIELDLSNVKDELEEIKREKIKYS